MPARECSGQPCMASEFASTGGQKNVRHYLLGIQWLALEGEAAAPIESVFIFCENSAAIF
jgi:hypothetical protein